MPDSIEEFLLSLKKDPDGKQDSIRELVDAYRDQQELISIGRLLSVEHDAGKLLRLILEASRKISGADAGSIFLAEKTGNERRLRFAYSYTYSIDVDYEEFSMPRDMSSIAGYVSLTGETLNIPDVYRLPENLPYRFNRGFDDAHGYRTKSMLVVPMNNHLNETIGVIQLINSKERFDLPDSCDAGLVKLESPEDYETKVVPFGQRYESLMVAIANQAAISIENSRMIAQIKSQFESFVHASVSAIESHDPSTSGHSDRVSALALLLARAVSETNEGEYAAATFTTDEFKELEYAGLLHDFGKIYLDPRVFLKAKKLYPWDYDILFMRLNYLCRSVELAEMVTEGLPELMPRLTETKTMVSILNEPVELPVDTEAEIRKISGIKIPDAIRGMDGEEIPVLTGTEITNLSIKRGSLNDDERKTIQSHVDYTWKFLSKIPWPPEYARIPEYAGKHHEMLDGSGYPSGCKAQDIPLQARILAVADIFDALSAKDRPYKKALPPEKVVAILKDEALKGKLDQELVHIFLKDVAPGGEMPSGVSDGSR